MPKAKWGTKPSLSAVRNIGKDDRRALLKFLIGKFPIPRHGVRVPTKAVKELPTLVKQ